MLIPSIDIMGGRAVQLRRGRKPVLTSLIDPLELARRFNRFGEVAVIDLDAALGRGDNRELIKKICRVADARVGGGIREITQGEEYLRAGAGKIIIGTKATPEFLSNFPHGKVQVALDHIGEEVLDNGWQNRTGEKLIGRAEILAPYCDSFLITFVEKEGGKAGLSATAAQQLLEKIRGGITIAGGVSDSANAVELLRLGLNVQVGMALYTESLDPIDVVAGTLDWSKGSLIPTIVTDQFGQILMTAYSSIDSLRAALDKGRGIYFSRSRNELWEKGLTSGNTQELISCRWDCDRDTLLFVVKQKGNACHTEEYSCFGSRRFSLAYLHSFLEKRRDSLPEGSYSSKLFKNKQLIDKKILEEAREVVEFTDRENLIWELADLIYFTLMKATSERIEFGEVIAELERRHK